MQKSEEQTPVRTSEAEANVLLTEDMHGERTLSDDDRKAVAEEIVRVCIGHCNASDTGVICGLLTEDLSGRSLSNASAQLSPELRHNFHHLAEFISMYPKDAPSVLAALKKALGELDYTDGRRYASYLLPDDGSQCRQLQNVGLTAEDFLREERKANRYHGDLPRHDMLSVNRD